MSDNKEEFQNFPPKSAKPNIPPVAPHHLLPPKEEENILRRSLKEIGEDMKKMEDLITLTEDIIRRERERDREFYLRERRRKLSANPSIPRHLFQVQKIEPREPQPSNFQCLEIPSYKVESVPKEPKSPLTFRKKITKRFKRKSIKSDKRRNSSVQDDPHQNPVLKSPTLKINTIGLKTSRKLIRFSPRKYRSKLYFRNGRIGCIDPENMSANQTNIEKTHAIVNYITSDVNYADTDAMAKRASITSNISDILSEKSSVSLEDLPNSNSYFNFDCSATESDDRGIADDDFFMNSLSDIDSFTVHPIDNSKSEEELAAVPDSTVDVIEVTIRQQSNDEETANNNAPPNNMPTSASDQALVDYVNETTSKHLGDSEDNKAPHSAMSNHSNTT